MESQSTTNARAGRLAAIVGLAFLLTVVACSPAPAASNVQTIDLIEDSGLRQQGFGTIRVRTGDGTELTAWTYRSTNFQNASGRIWFVMHGASRAAESYVEAAAPVAERQAALAIAIHFPESLFPNSDDYTLGVTRNGDDPYGGDISRVQWREPNEYLYGVVEGLFDAVRQAIGSQQPRYYLFGHSAGAQFVHRLVTFMPEMRVQRAVAANAGWYTMPTRGAPDDTQFNTPYGLRGSPVNDPMLARVLQRPLIVLVGTEDTSRAGADPLLRGTPEALSQGATRLERGRQFFSLADAEARRLGVDLGWRIYEAPGAGHDKDEVIQSAEYLLFADDAQPCASTTASAANGLEIVEIYADPADGPGGDANQDGRRDASEDEFLEFVNRGTRPICLTGWTIGDAKQEARHIFPVGPALNPGDSLIVFGGGIPSGSFNATRWQWATSGDLSLSNAGDVIVLRDSARRVSRAISWGDCDDAPCVRNHIAIELTREASAVRRAGTADAFNEPLPPGPFP